MFRSFLILLFTICSAGAKPFSPSHESSSSKPDPLQGWWVIESMRTWDANGKLTEISEYSGNYAFFSSQKLTIYKSIKMEKREEIGYRMNHSRNEHFGGIDLGDEVGKETMEALFLLKGDKLYLCLKLDEDKSRPNNCGPGKKHHLIEFTRYQPNHFVQTSKLPPSK
jgi:uncharacterized protein (TIGR03067 family)